MVEIGNKNLFECKCELSDLCCFSLGYGNNKKEAKADAAKKQIQMIAYIPDVESAILSILMSTRLSDSFTGSINPVIKTNSNFVDSDQINGLRKRLSCNTMAAEKIIRSHLGISNKVAKTSQD